ncbi:MAG: hypothetical protein KDD36_07930 [Flavobacteriales bacterium]|nr:hypothetical protein [Flavobacteriales bacterium]
MTAQERFMKYATRVVLTTVIFTGVAWLIRSNVLKGDRLEWHRGIPIIFYFMAVGLWSGYRMIRARDQEGNGFIRAFMVTSVMKLGAYFGLLFVCLWRWEAYTADVIILFAACYILFAALERTFLMNAMRKS